MTDRLTIDQITSDGLDQLYDRLDGILNAARLHRQGLFSTAELYAVIEAANDEADALAEQPARTTPNNTATSKEG